MSETLTVRELIRQLLDHPMDATVYVGKGMGPLAQVDSRVSDTAPDRTCIVLSPSTGSNP